MLRADDADAGRGGATSSPTRSASRPGCGSRRCSTRLWTNTDDVDRGWPRAVLDGDFTWLEDGVLDQSEGTGPWISSWSPGPSEKKNVWRPYGT